MASNVKYYSGNFAAATAVGALRNESPLLPDLNSVLIFHQDFEQLGANFNALPYNDANFNIGSGVNTGYLINESPREDMGGLVVKWTRSWARVPLSYSMSGGIYNYTFPGFDPGREPFNYPAKLRVLRDFFLCGNNGTFASWQTIPIARAFTPYAGNDSTEITNILRNAGTDSNGQPVAATVPSLAQYKNMISNGTEILAEDSKVFPWAGSIYVRENYYIVAT